MKTEDMKADRYRCGRGICGLHLQDWNKLSWEGGRLYKLREKRNVTEWYWPFRTWEGRKGDEGKMSLGNWSWEIPSSLGARKVKSYAHFSKGSEKAHLSVRKVKQQTCFSKESKKTHFSKESDKANMFQ